MDEIEKKIFRRKRQNASEHLDVNSKLLVEFKSANLLDDEAVDNIQAERNNGSRVNRLVESLLVTAQPGAFQLICDILLRHQPWLSKDLQMDVRLERGDLQIDDDVAKSASALVHRKFGTSKRFSEGDKKEISELIAIKLQLTKEDWKREMSELQERFEHQVEVNKSKDKQSRAVEAMVVRFLSDNKKELTTHAHDMDTTSDILTFSVSDNDVIQKLNKKMTFLLQKLQTVIKQKELLKNEREKCMEALNVKNNETKLNEVIISQMADLPQKVEKLEQDVKQKGISARKLRGIVDEMENEMEEKDAKLKLVEDEMTELKAQVTVYQEKLRYLEFQNSRRISQVSHTAPVKSTPRKASTAYHRR